MGFGERLKIARKAMGLSQRDLARILGISVNSLANYERGTSFPKENYLYRIINVLEIEPNYLFQDIVSIDEKNRFEEIELLADYRSLSGEGRSYISYVTAREAEKRLLTSITMKKFHDKYIALDLKSSLFRKINAKGTINKIREMTKGSTKSDYYILILGNKMRPVFSDGDVAGIKRVQQLEEKQMGVYEIDGYIDIAVKYKDMLKSISGTEIELRSETPTLYGRVIEIIKDSDMRKD